MKIIFAVFLLSTILLLCEGLENYLQSPLYPCIVCLCHARSGCWRRENCARYSISSDYWKEAGSLVVDSSDNPNDDSSFRKCMQNENCIVGTIIKYTEKFGNIDCNCDGKFDCKDRSAIHLFKNKCENPKFGRIYASRFNECAARVGVNTMLSEEGDGSCTAPEVEVF